MKHIEAKTTTIRLSPELHEALLKLASREGRDLGDQINWAILKLLAGTNTLPPAYEERLLQREALILRFGLKAQEIVQAAGWRDDIIAETARQLMAEGSVWADDYRAWLGADPYSKIKNKDRINPLLGKRARSILNATVGKVYKVEQPSIFSQSTYLRAIEEEKAMAA
jgi:hypothetical protein